MEVIPKNYSPEELLAMVENFSINTNDIKFSPLTSGLINETYLVYCGKRPSYILQRINAVIFKDVDGLMNNSSRSLAHLESKAYTKIELISTKNGEKFYKGPEGYWRMVSYIPDTVTYDTTNSLKVAFEAGRIVGMFQILLQHEDPDNYIDTIPDFHNLKYRTTQFEEALSNAPKSKLIECEPTITFVKATIMLLEENIETNLPVRICHNDTKLNNILFSAYTENALCLIDLDTIMRGHFMFDFGDAVRTVVNPAREDEQKLSLIDFRKEYFEALVNGLASNEHIWTHLELQSLPYGAVLIPFIQGLRALTDYLNGNRYFKVSYEKQNYHRALSLFEFSKKALENLSFMKQTISRSFPKNSFN